MSLCLCLLPLLHIPPVHRAPAVTLRHIKGNKAHTQDTESEANVTADNSDAPPKPNEKLVEETIDKIDGKHHGGKGELRVSRGPASAASKAEQCRATSSSEAASPGCP